MKSTIQIIIIILFSSNVINSQTLLDEKFEGTTMPSGWTFQATTTDPIYTWTFYSEFDNLEIKESKTVAQNEWLITPSYDLSTFSNIYLTFSPWMYQDRTDFSADTFDIKVVVSTNGGTVWNEVWSDDELTTTDFDGTFFYSRAISKSLQSFCGAGMTNVKVGFQFISNGTATTDSNYVYLMDVKISTDCPITTLKNYSNTGVSWFPINNFSGTYEIEYGPRNFIQGAGTLVTGLTSNSYSFPLNICRYDCYIRTNCGGTNTPWTKFSFNNNIQNLTNTNTSSNSNTINWSGFGQEYEIEYGVLGFTRGSGTFLLNLTGTSRILTGLNSNTNYSCFIRSKCDGLFSGYRRIDFTTSVLSSANFKENNNILIYPNPTKNSINIDLSIGEIKEIQLYDLKGSLLKSELLNFKEIDLTRYSKGIYLLKTSTEDNVYFTKIIKE